MISHIKSPWHDQRSGSVYSVVAAIMVETASSNELVLMLDNEVSITPCDKIPDKEEEDVAFLSSC